MHRKKEDNGGRRRFFGRAFSSKLDSDWKKPSGKGSEDTSNTRELSSEESSCQKGSDTLCDLPNWENPLANSSVSGDKSPSPLAPVKNPTAANTPSRSTRLPRAPTQTHHGLNLGAAAPAAPPSKPDPEALENMIVTFSDSTSTLGEDITLCDFGEYEVHPRRQYQDIKQDTLHVRSPTRKNDHSRYPSQKSPPEERPRNYTQQYQRRGNPPSPPSIPHGVDDEMTAEQIQEEEMIQLAMERSLAESNSTMQQSLDSPTKTTRRGIMPHPPPSRAEVSAPPLRSNANNSTSKSMSRKIQTDASGAKFIWKKGKGGRYMKVPLNEIDEEEVYSDNYSAAGSSYATIPTNHAKQRWGAGTTTAATTTTKNEPDASRLDRMEQKLIEQAMEQSMASLESSPESLRSAAAGLSDDQMMALAMERSREDTCSVSSGISAGMKSTQSTPLIQGFMHMPQQHPPQEQRRQHRRSSFSGGGVTSSSSSRRPPGQNFIWKKGPNNRYYKCPIGLDQVNEGEVYGQPQAEDNPRSLDQMEQDMLQQAMALSLKES